MADNYIYILLDKDTKQTACVDPGVTMRWKAFLKKKNETRFHIKHSSPLRPYRGNSKFKQKYNCKIVGNKHDAIEYQGLISF